MPRCSTRSVLDRQPSCWRSNVRRRLSGQAGVDYSQRAMSASKSGLSTAPARSKAPVQGALGSAQGGRSCAPSVPSCLVIYPLPLPCNGAQVLTTVNMLRWPGSVRCATWFSRVSPASVDCSQHADGRFRVLTVVNTTPFVSDPNLGWRVDCSQHLVRNEQRSKFRVLALGGARILGSGSGAKRSLTTVVTTVNARSLKRGLQPDGVSFRSVDCSQRRMRRQAWAESHITTDSDGGWRIEVLTVVNTHEPPNPRLRPREPQRSKLQDPRPFDGGFWYLGPTFLERTGERTANIS